MAQVQFETAMVRAEFLNPLKNFEKESYDIEIRKDPLLGMTSVYNPNLRDKAKAFFGENDPDLIQRLVEESEKTCIFCGEKPEQGSPKYLPELLPEGRIKVGEAVLFANLFPLAQYHPVVSLCKTHFLSLSGFRSELLTNGFRAGQSFLKAVHDRDAGAVYATINMNYLFPAGASLVHPHLQMLIGPAACSYHARLADAAKVYYQTYGSSYFCDLIAEEEGRGSRLIGRTGRWHWMTAFSPMGSNEIMAVHEEEADAGVLSDDDLTSLAQGICSVLAFFESLGHLSFNFTLYSIRSGRDAGFRSVLKIINRQNLYPNYRNDDYFLQKMLNAELIIIPPEDLAEKARVFFSPDLTSGGKRSDRV